VKVTTMWIIKTMNRSKETYMPARDVETPAPSGLEPAECDPATQLLDLALCFLERNGQ